MVHIRTASPGDVPVIVDMLREAAQWVDALGIVMWDDEDLAAEQVAADVAAGQFMVAEYNGEVAGAVRFQLEDRLFWPDLPGDDRSAFVHRLVVRRRFKGQGLSSVLLWWAIDRARALGRSHLRLDCDAHRGKLRDLYERVGFRVHSLRQVGRHRVARYEFPLA